MPRVLHSHVQSAIFLDWCRIGKYSCSHFFPHCFVTACTCFQCFLLSIFSPHADIMLFYFPSQEWFDVNDSSLSKWSPTFVSGRLLMIFSTSVNVVINWKFVSTVFLFILYKSHLTVCTIPFLTPLMYAMLGR